MPDLYPLETYGGHYSGMIAKLHNGALEVSGEVADRIGRLALNRAANRYGYPVRVITAGAYHPEGTVYQPGGPGYA